MSSLPIKPFDPDNWVTSLFRALENYVLIKSEDTDYEIIGSFPPTELFTERQPLERTIIHFEFDDIRNPWFGFGDNVVDAVYDDTAQTVLLHEAKPHIVNIDVGVWASERSGGGTARMEAYEFLTNIFNGTLAYRDLRDNWGIEIQSFNGGNFIEEDINDIAIWRVAGLTLIVRVFSRSTPPAPIPYIVEDITQEPNLSVQPGTPINEN